MFYLRGAFDTFNPLCSPKPAGEISQSQWLRGERKSVAMNIAKWLPKQNNDMNKIFTETRNIERELRILGKKFATNINYKNPDYYVSRSRRGWIHAHAVDKSSFSIV